MAVNFPEWNSSQVIQPTGPLNVPGSNIGDAVTRLGAAMSDTASAYAHGASADDAQKVFEARQRGVAAFYRDENGTPQVRDIPAADSPENRAYIESAQATYTAEVSNYMRDQAAMLRTQYANDPSAFRSAYDKVAADQLAGAPAGWLPITKLIVDRHGTDAFVGLQIAANDRQNSLDKSNWTTELGDLRNQMLTLAEGGQVGDARYATAQMRTQELLQAGEKRGWMDARSAQLYREDLAVRAGSAGIANMVLGDANRKVQEGASSAEAYTYGRDRLEDLLKKPELSTLTAREREAVRDTFDERWRERTAQSAAQTAEIDRNMQAKVDGLQRGMDVSPADFADIRQQYLSAGNAQKADEAAMWASVSSDVQALVKRPIPEIQAGLDAARRGEVTPATVRFMTSAEHVLRQKITQAQQEVANLQQELQAIGKGIELNQPPPLDRLAAIGNRLVELGQGEKATDLLRNVDALKKAADAAQDPIPKTAALLETLRQQTPGVDTTPYVAAMQEMLDKKIAGMRDDPMGYGAQLHSKAVGPLSPISWSDAIDPQKTDGLISTLKGRVTQAGMVSALEPGVDVPPLTKDEMGALSHTLQVANADQKVALASALGDGLGESGIGSITPRLFKDGVEQRVFGIAAEIAPQRQQVARSIFIGQDILSGRGGERVSSMPKAEETRLMMQQMLYPAFDQHAINDPQERNSQINLPAVYDRYQATSSAVTAYYAYLARGQENPRQEDLMKQAVDAVTGGVLDGPNGYKVFAPRPGMSQGEFDAIWGGLRNEDFGPIAPTTVTGETISARDIMDRGILRSVGDGEYEVWMNGSGGLLFQLYRPDNRTPAVISLRDKSPPAGAGITPWMRYGAQN